MRVLVVEVEPKVASAISRGLRKHGYAVDISADGVDALSMASEYDYDAIVLDLMIPVMDGVDVSPEGGFSSPRPHWPGVSSRPRR